MTDTYPSYEDNNFKLPVENIEQHEQASRIQWSHILILGGLSAFGALSVDMYVPALPAISHNLEATMSQTQLTLSAFILGMAIGNLIIGPISDAQGRRRPLLVGLAAYVVTSLQCIVAPSIELLTVMRFAQGIAGAAGIVIALAVARDLYSGTNLARLFSLLIGIQGLSPIIAPVVGSQLLAFTSWRGIFAVLALAGVGMFVAVAFALNETLPLTGRQRGGIATSLNAFRQILTDRRFTGFALSVGFAFAAGIVYISVAPFVLENIYDVSPQFVGFLMAANAVGLVIMTQVSSRLVGRVTPQILLFYGVTAIAIGSMALFVAVLSGIGLIGILPAMFVVVASLGLIAPNATTLAIADSQATGSASAVLGILQLIIGAIAAPLAGLAGTSSAFPMAVVIAAFGAATFITYIVTCRPIQDQNMRSLL